MKKKESVKPPQAGASAHAQLVTDHLSILKFHIETAERYRLNYATMAIDTMKGLYNLLKEKQK